VRAIVVTRHGGPDVLSVEDRPEPEVGPGQIVVRTEAAGVNYADIYMREGGGFTPGPPPFVAGLDGAGVVESVGDGVTDFAVGDRAVWNGVPGSYAELVLLNAAKAVPVPDGVATETAAAVFLQGLTAHYLATSTYAVQPGDAVLVHAAAGGVGNLLTQIATKRGGRVIATASTTEKRALALEAGATDAIPYEGFRERVLELTGNVGVAAVFDAVGAATIDESLGAARPRGVVVLYGASSGPVPSVEPSKLMARSLYFTRPTLDHYVGIRADLLARAGDLFAWIADDSLHVRIGGRYPLAEVARAHTDLADRLTVGKLLLLPEAS
jgi:NADPH2:quinone reductase